MRSKDYIVADLQAIDERLGWREEKGILSGQGALALELLNLAAPFLDVFIDIRDLLLDIREQLPPARE